MTIDETVQVLTKAAAFDQRTVGEGDIAAWNEVLPGWVILQDALTAVTSHYRLSTQRLMPAHLILHAGRARARRTGQPMYEGD